MSEFSSSEDNTGHAPRAAFTPPAPQPPTPPPSSSTSTTDDQTAKAAPEIGGDHKGAVAVEDFLADWSRMKMQVYRRYVRTLTLLQLSISIGVVLVIGLHISNVITFGVLVAALPLGLVSGRVLVMLCERFAKRPLRQWKTRFPDTYPRDLLTRWQNPDPNEQMSQAAKDITRRLGVVSGDTSELDEHGDNWISSVLLFGLGSFILVGWAATSLPPFVQAMVFLLFALVTIVLSAVLWNDRLQEEAQKRDLFRGGPAAPLVYDLIVVLVAVALYGGATFALAQHYPATMKLASPLGGLSVERVETFYAWHIADSVPALKITQTLGWSAPLTYRSWKVGVLVLLFKLSIIVPIVGSVRVFWHQRQRRARAAEASS